MRILILEDDPKRHKAFRLNLIGHDIKIVEETHDAIECLLKESWDALFLDHDLHNKVYCDSGPDTGFEVAEWLSKQMMYKPKIVVTHSYHEVGRKNIINVLPGTIEAPGLWNYPQIVLSDS